MFRDGLMQEIRVLLASQPPTTYAEALNKALDIELAMQSEMPTPPLAPSQPHTSVSAPQDHQTQNFKRKWENKNFPNKKQWQGPSQQKTSQSRPPFQGQPRSTSGQPRVPNCPRCNKAHSGVCKWGSNSCYNCGQVGHFSSHCPHRSRGSEVGGTRPSNTFQQNRSLKAMIGYPQQSHNQASFPSTAPWMQTSAVQQFPPHQPQQEQPHY